MEARKEYDIYMLVSNSMKKNATCRNTPTKEKGITHVVSGWRGCTA